MQGFDQRGAELTSALQDNAGINPRSDAWTSGYITCIKDLLNVDFEETQ